MSAMRCSYGLAFDDVGTINEIDQKRSILENGTLSLLSYACRYLGTAARFHATCIKA